MTKINYQRIDKAIDKLERAAKEFTMLVKSIKLYYPETTALVENLKRAKRKQSDGEICPDCSTPLVIQQERAEVPWLIRTIAVCPGCGYTEI